MQKLLCSPLVLLLFTGAATTPGRIHTSLSTIGHSGRTQCPVSKQLP